MKIKKIKVKHMIIFNFCAIVLIAILWFLLWPLRLTEMWTAPGDIVRIDPMINSQPLKKHSDQSNQTNLYMTYVKETEIKSRWEKIYMSLLGYEKRAILQSFASAEESDFTERDLNGLGKVLIPYMKHDIIKAVMVHENIDWKEDISKPIVVYHPEKFKTGKDLMIGDEIVSLNGSEIESPEDVNVLLENSKVGDNVMVTVIRDQNKIDIPITIRELDQKGQATLGVFMKNRFTFQGLSEDEVIQLGDNYSGESGGFILALGLVQQLRPDLDLSKGRKIAGTGGISRGGDIQPIGNLDLKVLTASKANADVFIYPKFQEDQVMAAMKKYKITNIKLVGVRNINDAISNL